MCETFKWIKLLAVELPRDGLQIRVKFLWANDCERRKSFSKYVKMQIFVIGHQISIYGLDINFSKCHMS